MKKLVLVALFVLTILVPAALAAAEIKETVRDIPSDSWTETKKLYANEYVVYRFQGNATNIVNVSLEVVSGDSMDTFLFSSEDFANYQSMIQGAGPDQFNSYPVGRGLNIKYQSYSFKVPAAGTYYIVADNSIEPKGGSQPSGSIEVKVKFTKSRCLKCEEDALEKQKRTDEAGRLPGGESNNSKEPASIPGFHAIDLALALMAVFYLKRRI